MPANPSDLWAWMHSAKAAELSQLIKEASLRVILKTSCCVLSPHFCKSISEWSGLTLPTPASAWTQPSAPRQSWPCWKNTQVNPTLSSNQSTSQQTSNCGYKRALLPLLSTRPWGLWPVALILLGIRITQCPHWTEKFTRRDTDPHQTYGPLSIWFLLGRLAEIEIEL